MHLFPVRKNKPFWAVFTLSKKTVWMEEKRPHHQIFCSLLFLFPSDVWTWKALRLFFPFDRLFSLIIFRSTIHSALFWSSQKCQIWVNVFENVFLTGFGDAVDNSQCWDPIIHYVENQFDNYLESEMRVARFPIADQRVHVCLYFIAPTGHALKPLDIEFMKRIHDKVSLPTKLLVIVIERTKG